MRRKRVTMGVLVLVAVFFTAASASAVLLSMSQFGIRVPAKNLYSAAGKTASGTIVDVSKARLGAGLTQSRQGQRVEVTYLGNGWVQVRNRVTGEQVKIEVREPLPDQLPAGR